MATAAKKQAEVPANENVAPKLVLASFTDKPARPIDFNALREPFDKADIHWRAQSVTANGDKALALAYIDARNVMERLDAIVGPENWQDSYEETSKGRVICTLSLRIDGRWISKSDGAGNTDVEGDKGAVSDALKRAAVKWGIGRYLYSMPATWVPCECYAEKRNNKWVWKRWVKDPWDYVKVDPSLPPLGDDPPHDPETGEILDTDEAGTRQPQAREKLDGPHKTRTALRNAVMAILTKVRAATDEAQIDTILIEAKDTIKQANKDWPGLINGDPNNADDPGLKGAVTAMREQLSEDGIVSGMIRAIKECDTKQSLENWMIANEEAVAALDGAESRRFQLAYDLQESNINEMDKARA